MLCRDFVPGEYPDAAMFCSRREMEHSMTRILDDLRSYRWFLAAAVLIGAGWILVRALPPRHLVIETGPVSGSYFQIAQEYAKRFAELGITLELRPRDDSLSIIRDVNDTT